MTKPAWLRGVHHDGSSVYVSDPLPAFDDTVQVRLRVPKTAPVTSVFLRTAPDGEQVFTPLAAEAEDTLSVWYAGPLTVQNAVITYRFKLMTDEGAYYYNAQGGSRADSPDTSDFKLIADFAAPSWLSDTVFYQIFPDRFYNGDEALTPPPGNSFQHPPHGEFETSVRAWDDDPLHFEQGGTVDFFGGDLPGIVQKLDYLQSLGVNALYLNPVFTSPTNHKYNINDFYGVDPHFGGNDALVMLRKALDRANMYYVLDLTPNHSGDQNPWFTAAQQNPDAPTASFYTFYEHPAVYECWQGVKTLPKLNYKSEALRDKMYRARDAVMRFWLQEPFRADGWRLDVWNMTARQGATNVQHDVGREMRAAVKAENPAVYLFGEHFFDATASLQGDQMDATMNYSGFTFPVWRWLAGYDLGSWSKAKQPFSDTVPIPAEALVEQLTAYMAAIPWVIARMQFNQLSSHDIPRILTVVQEDEALAQLATALLFTFPGVPCVYYGDEIGMVGGREPDNRRGMIWDESRQNQDLLATYRKLITLRRTYSALTEGGFQFLQARGGLLAYQRTSQTDSLVFVGYRGEAPMEDVVIPVADGGIPDGTQFQCQLTQGTYTAQGGQLAVGTLHVGDVLVLTAPTG